MLKQNWAFFDCQVLNIPWCTLKSLSVLSVQLINWQEGCSAAQQSSWLFPAQVGGAPVELLGAEVDGVAAPVQKQS